MFFAGFQKFILHSAHFNRKADFSSATFGKGAELAAEQGEENEDGFDLEGEIDQGMNQAAAQGDPI